jgi:hypothetical protein
MGRTWGKKDRPLLRAVRLVPPEVGRETVQEVGAAQEARVASLRWQSAAGQITSIVPANEEWGILLP